MKKCYYCYRRIWPWQKSNGNGALHAICNHIWHRGYNIALSVVKDSTLNPTVSCWIPPETFMASTSPTGGNPIRNMTSCIDVADTLNEIKTKKM